MWSRAELKAKAKELLNANYWRAVLVSLILSFVSGSGSAGGSAGSNSQSFKEGDFEDFFSEFTGVNSAYFLAIAGIIILVAVVIALAGIALKILVFNPLIVGCYRYFVLCKQEEPALGEVVFAFSHSYWNIVKIMFLKDLFEFLWSLLLVIPGIVKGYEYRMIPYLLSENPALSKEEAFAMTKQMMTGDKWNAFVLDLSFLGWNLLGALTCCILILFYVAPYQNLTNAQLYEALKGKNYYQQNQYE